MTTQDNRFSAESAIWAMMSEKLDGQSEVLRSQSKVLEDIRDELRRQNDRDHEILSEFREYRAASEEKFKTVFKAQEKFQAFLYRGLGGASLLGGGAVAGHIPGIIG